MPATTLNLASLLTNQARLTPDRPAIVMRPIEMTYAQLDGKASRVAAGLAARGVQAGDRVGLFCPNTPHFPMAYYGILKLGAIVVPINVLLKPREVAQIVRDCAVTVLFSFEGTPALPMAATARAALDEVGGDTLLVVMTVDPVAETAPVDRAITLGALIGGQLAHEGVHDTAPDDTAVILYTSGTTGQPRGAELTHLNMTLNAMSTRDMLGLGFPHGPDARPVVLVTLPLFHSTAQTAELNAGIAGGWTLVLMPRFDPGAVLEAFAGEDVNGWIGVPTMYWDLLRHAEETGADLVAATRSLVLCVSGGASMPVAVMEAFEHACGVRILEGYGLSETSPVACFNQMNRQSKPGTVGLPIAGCQVRVVDDEDRPVPARERGEVLLRGPNVMKGYYGRPAETAEALRGGWFHTGDIGVLDEDGYLSIVDRKKDIVIRGGMNVYPREVEELLMTHPAVSLAAVIGVPDERLGEEVKAIVVRRPGMNVTGEELAAFSRERMAAYKYPRHVEFRESLPLGPTGKVLKRALRA
ncbi:MAG TPA: long-chain fatty acid--CoA ligase [Vicinamibacterales bacterium]|nr:long-chain fatty acid--CoA ligase [Vicinamibacterales bacterium]